MIKIILKFLLLTTVSICPEILSSKQKLNLKDLQSSQTDKERRYFHNQSNISLHNDGPVYLNGESPAFIRRTYLKLFCEYPATIDILKQALHYNRNVRTNANYDRIIDIKNPEFIGHPATDDVSPKPKTISSSTKVKLNIKTGNKDNQQNHHRKIRLDISKNRFHSEFKSRRLLRKSIIRPKVPKNSRTPTPNIPKQTSKSGYDFKNVENFSVPTKFIFELKNKEVKDYVNRYKLECAFLTQFTFGIVFKFSDKNINFSKSNPQYLISIIDNKDLNKETKAIPRFAIKFNNINELIVEHRPVNLYSNPLDTNNPASETYNFDLKGSELNNDKWHTLVVSLRFYNNSDFETSAATDQTGSDKGQKENELKTVMPNVVVIQLDCDTPIFRKLPIASQEPLDLRTARIFVGSKNELKSKFSSASSGIGSRATNVTRNELIVDDTTHSPHLSNQKRNFSKRKPGQFKGHIKILGLSTQSTEIADKLCQYSKNIETNVKFKNFAEKNDEPSHFSRFEYNSDDFMGTLRELLKENNFNVPGRPPVLMMNDGAVANDIDTEGSNLSVHETSTHLQNEPTCEISSRGQLYYNPSSQLKLCSGRNWIHLTSAGPRLDYISFHQKLKLDSPSNDIEIFEIPKIGIFLINAELNSKNDKGKRIVTLYFYKDGMFRDFQKIRSRLCNSWTYFNIGGSHFLGSANRRESRRKKPVYWPVV